MSGEWESAAMAPPLKTKRSFSHNTQRPSVMLTKGDWLDVMDHDGVWNVARVLSVPSPEEVEVMYDGWPEEYDEIVRVDSDRVAPYHTFTWAVKCWVKYLNWPMWPSVITIRTPGTAGGIENLAMENRLYVDFLDDPSFAKRDRCWQKKRQVKVFDHNYNKNRMGTNGAQFEGAMASFLRSDATKTMPKFARGTLPMQYENSTTDTVEQMRKSMGNGLWYRNFANNKERHKLTHFYDTIGDDNDNDNDNDKNNEDSADEAVLVSKLKVRRPIMSSINEERKPNPQKKKRPLPAQNVHVTVNIEQEPPAEVEASYEVEEMESSDDQANDRAVLLKKQRLRAKKRSAVFPVTKRKISQKGKISTSSEDTNAAATMPRHVTVMMDEIIVDDDDDSGSGEVDRRKVVRTTRTLPRKLRTISTPIRAKEERDGAPNLLSRSDSDASVDTDTGQSSCKLRTNANKSDRVRQRIRRRKSEESAKLHREAWNGIFSGFSGSPSKRSKRNDFFLLLSDKESDDDNGFSDGFDPGITSEDKLSSPFDSQFSSQDAPKASLSGRVKRKADDRVTPINVPVSSRPTKKSSNDKGQTKMAAKRSIPPLKNDINLVASPKPSRSSRPPSDDDWEDEEKGVLRDAVEKVERHELPNKSVIGRRLKQSGDSKQRPDGVTDPPAPAQRKTSRRSKISLPLIEQRIAFAQEVLRDLDKEKQEATKTMAPKAQQKTSSSSLSSGLHSESQANLSRANRTKPRSYQSESSDMSFLRVDDKENEYFVTSGISEKRQGKVAEVPTDFGLHSNQLDHSFLSVDEACSSDSQESKGVPTPFDERVTIGIQSDPKQTKRAKKAEAKSLAEAKSVVGGKQVVDKKSTDEDAEEEKSQEVRRHFCVMQAGLEGTLEINEYDKTKARNSKKTVISVPRKFGKPAKEVSYVFTSSTDTMLRIAPPPPESGDGASEALLSSPSTAVFSSSEGFSMENWFKRTLGPKYRSSKI